MLQTESNVVKERPIAATGFFQPPEWAKHDAVWLAWPSHKDLWKDKLPWAQSEFIAFCEAIADICPLTGFARGERLKILVPDEESGVQAETQLRHLPKDIYLIPFGDIWLRDTAPVFLQRGDEIAAARFAFNGWGGKFDLPQDSDVARRIVAEASVKEFSYPFVLEGGSVEVDGEGTCLTSRQCLLNPNRNPEMSQYEIEKGLEDALGVTKVLWLDQGLINDHTDGHIDTIARLVGPAKVLCMKGTESGDPNRDILTKIAIDLSRMVDARGRRLKVGTVPSPGSVRDDDGNLMPASYLNFYIANTTVIVPTYNSHMDQAAVQAIAEWFPTRKTVGIPAKAILSGGGAFHCISQQQPAKDWM